MKWIIPVESMRQADRYCIEKLRIPGLLLMEAAARSVVDRMVECIKQSGCKTNDWTAQKVLVLCGGGNNGGDGFAIARMLKGLGMTVRVYVAADIDHITGDAKTNLDMLSAYQISVFSQDQASIIEKMIDQSDWVVDALFGTGLDREIHGLIAQLIGAVNEAQAAGKLKVVAVDIPSGIEGDNGQIMGCAMRANETVTFCRLKQGLILFPGCDYAGHVTVADIGIPDTALPLKDASRFMLEPGDLPQLLPKRMSRSHKGLYGRLLSVSGSASMPGAAVLSGRSAYKMGTGLVDIAVPEAAKTVLQTSLPEAVTTPYQPGEVQWIAEKAGMATAVLAGPGLGTESYVEAMLDELLTKTPARIPMVLDADALNMAARRPSLAKKIAQRGHTIVTPHMGEAARLLGVPVRKVMERPIEAAKEIAAAYQSVVVLKDAMTLVCEPGGLLFFNSTGNNGMSTAGSGDVLAGMIAGLCAEGMEVFPAAYTGVYLHGAAGDLAKEEKGLYGMVASDIVNHIHLEKIQERIAKPL